MIRAALFLMALSSPVTAQTVDPASLPPVPSARGLQLFDAICGDSLPDFATAPQRMAANGLTTVAATGTVYSTRENLSFKVVNGPGAGKTCSMVMGSLDNAATFATTMSQIGPFAQTQMGPTAPYRNRNTVAVLGGQPTTVGNINYHNIRIFSER